MEVSPVRAKVKFLVNLFYRTNGERHHREAAKVKFLVNLFYRTNGEWHRREAAKVKFLLPTFLYKEK